MPSRDEIVTMALRSDTAVSRAFLRALGVPRPWRFASAGGWAPRPPSAHRHGEGRRYLGMAECMRNDRSPMNGLR